MSTTPVVVDNRVPAEELALALVEAAKRAGAALADATVGLSASLSASARDGAIEELTRSQSRGAAVRVIVDERVGFATSSDAPQTPEEIEELVATAVGLARLSSPSPHNVLLAGADLSADTIREAVDALGIWDDATAELDPAWAVEQATIMERVVRGHQGVTGVREVSASMRRGIFALATSTGFVGSSRGTTASLSCSAVVQDREGSKLQIESWWQAARRLGVLVDAVGIADMAATRALARRGARAIPSTTMPVVFDPNMARGFFVGVLGALSGDAVARKQSWLLDAVGDVVMPAGTLLVDDPLVPGGFASRVFDGEGQAARRTILIDDGGRLQGFLLDARSAARLGLSSTGHAARGATSLPHVSASNVRLEGGQGSQVELCAPLKRGLLVTRLLGRGADSTTGDLSRGASGFLIEDGEVTTPVEGITIAGNAREMLQQIDAVGADIDERSSLAVPSIRFSSLSIGGSGQE